MDSLAYTYRSNHGILGMIVLVLDVIVIVSLLMGPSSVGHRLLWILLVLFLPFIGTLLCFLVGRSTSDA